MNRRRGRADRRIVLGALLTLVSFTDSARAGDFASDTVKIVSAARQLQSPAQAVATLGDPVAVHGTASPQLTFNAFRFGIDNRNVGAEVTLSYLPPVHAPRRLDVIAIYYVPVPAESLVRQWLGPPKKIDDKGIRGRTFVYDGADRAGIGVWFVAWDGRHVIIFARGQ